MSSNVGGMTHDPASKRLVGIRHSQTLATTAKMAALKAAGRDVIALSSGSPDFDTPDHIKQAAVEAIWRGETRYTEVAGTTELRRAVAEKFQRDSGLVYSLDEIMVSTGGKQIIFNAMLATLDPGDEVIIPTPCWVSYPEIVSLAEGSPVLVPCAMETGFKLRADQFEAAITPRTKWFILNNPCNPTGAVYSVEELRALSDVLMRHPHVMIFADDIYEKLTYGDVRAATMVEVEPQLKSRTVTMNGCSKAYAMTGWRIGFCGAPASLIRAMNKLQGQSTSSTSSISQAAAVEALTGSHDFIADMILSYRERRDLVVNLLKQVPGLDCPIPEGAFYVFPSVGAFMGKTSASGVTLHSDIDFANALAEEQGVGVVPGSAFMYPGHVRISYTTRKNRLEDACHRIVRFCQELGDRPVSSV